MSIWAVVTLILLIAVLISYGYLVRVVRTLSVDSRSVSQGERSWLDYGSFFVVLCGIAAAIIGFIAVLLFLRDFNDLTQALGFLTAFFGAIVGLTGTYFGIKTSSDATAGAQRLVAASGGDTTPPQILTINPPDQAGDVSPNIRLTASFSKDMDRATINPNTFKLLDTSTLEPVLAGPNGVNYDEPSKVATFKPGAPLQNGRKYAATITASVKDKAGNTLEQDKTWHFTTEQGGGAAQQGGAAQ